MAWQFPQLGEVALLYCSHHTQDQKLLREKSSCSLLYSYQLLKITAKECKVCGIVGAFGHSNPEPHSWAQSYLRENPSTQRWPISKEQTPCDLLGKRARRLGTLKDSLRSQLEHISDRAQFIRKSIGSKTECEPKSQEAHWLQGTFLLECLWPVSMYLPSLKVDPPLVMLPWCRCQWHKDW